MNSKLQLFGFRSHLSLNPARFLLHPLVLFPQLFIEVSSLILTRVYAAWLSSDNPILLLIIVIGRECSLLLQVLEIVWRQGLDVREPILEGCLLLLCFLRRKNGRFFLDTHAAARMRSCLICLLLGI